MEPDRKKVRYFRLATESYRGSNSKLWVSAFACNGVVGHYDRGATMGLASDMGVSVDTIEDLAHAYGIYNELCALDKGRFRQFVRNARRAPFIYYSHFRALWDVRSQYKLTNEQILDLLMDVVQGEGQISARSLDGHVRGKYGDTRGWDFYGNRAKREISQTLQQPDLPNTPEVIGNVYLVTFLSNSEKVVTVPVIAHNPQRAEAIARKQVALTRDAKQVKQMTCSTKVIAEAVTDSKNILTMTHSWLEDKA